MVADRFSWLAWGVGISVALVQPSVLAKSATEVNDIAQSITVKIATGDGNGSGILLQKQGDVYTILTAAHVVKNAGASYTITTPDDRTYQPIANSIRRYQGDVDLALLKFRSSASYKLADLGDSNVLKGGTEIYVAGFPTPTQVITESIFVFRNGQVTANSKRVFKNGYALLYSNNTLPGMSGGPVLDVSGKVVGVHGKGDREVETGIKTGFNAAIPIARFADISQSLGINLGINVATTIQSPTLTADDYLLSAFQKRDKNDFRGALVDLDLAIALNPEHEKSYRQRGDLKFLSHKQLPYYQEAYLAARRNGSSFKVIEESLKLAELKYALEALADYNKAIALNPSNASTYEIRGHLKSRRFFDDLSALADYNKAIALDPKGYDYLEARGRLKVEKLKDLSGGIKDLERALQLKPKDNKDITSDLGSSLEELKGYQNSLTLYSQRITLNPKDAIAYASRGTLKGQYLYDSSGGIADLEQALKLALENNYNIIWVKRIRSALAGGKRGWWSFDTGEGEGKPILPGGGFG